ncbi:uncharacterized protein B0I36DRAFT_377578 [Microdochium trichocladiopsis]|uniref:RTA1 domain protein n=1 Tax=Microdochium trichocladiopsis TaxID=1682393 RepID=A0A9P8XTZ8_9PEZI|nr:uncharacterized protein B0I36DRAFT_377578 [Microdochium trichocladiopsis]KAH7018320.1 hypothetical protein B0I36DRAFT_377578 [Microdochium trichocladiopsis]
MGHGDWAPGSIWFYAPNKGAAIFYTIAFASTGICHAYQSYHYKSWRLTGLFAFCGLLYTVGFIFRCLGAWDYDDLIKYIVSICLTFAAPPLNELANFYLLGRILYYIPYYSPIHPGRVLSTFAFLSAVVESISGWGASYMANQSLTPEQQAIGYDLLRAALIIQLGVIALFLSLATYFYQTCRRHGIRNNHNLNQVMINLYASNALILTRCIFRTVEFFQTEHIDWEALAQDPTAVSPIIRYEAFFYIFEASLMLCNMIMFNIRHPRRWLPKSTKVYLARDGVTEIMGPGYKQDRNFILTIIDPFDITSKITGKDKTSRFWELDEHDSNNNQTAVHSEIPPIATGSSGQPAMAAKPEALV